MTTLVAEEFAALWRQAVSIWLSGGWAMWALAFVSLVMFGMGMHVYLRLREKAFRAVPEATWRHWIQHHDEREGPIGDLLEFATSSSTLPGIADAFKQLRANETAPFDRDLRVMTVCVSAAPLVGLLGTVTGMLATFGALASGSGGDKTMAMIASGISEALITTETGLVIALPGLFLHYQLTRTYERYKAFLAHLETVCTQQLYRQTQRRLRQAQHLQARRAALAQITDTLQRAVAS
jgi:biopolymer transport protein ExbB